jgi:hypothetical protein
VRARASPPAARERQHPGVVPIATTAPNDLWTPDFKGQFRTGNGLYCCPLTIADQHTRFPLERRSVKPVQRGGAGRQRQFDAFRAGYTPSGRPTR